MKTKKKDKTEQRKGKKWVYIEQKRKYEKKQGNQKSNRGRRKMMERERELRKGGRNEEIKENGMKI